MMYKMLIVDDSPAETECMQYLVQKYNFPLTTRIAGNGQEAFEMFKQEKFDILLTDIKMPYMDGLKLAALVRKVDADIPIILFSGFSEFSYARTAISLDVLEYLLKPVDPEEFKQTLTSVLQTIDKRKRDSMKTQQIQRRMLYMLLNGVSVENCEECLPRYDRMILISFEKDFFNSVGENFETEFKNSFPFPFDFISPFPSQGVAFFPAGSDHATVLIERIRMFIKNQYASSCHIVTAPLQNLKDIFQVYQYLDSIYSNGDANSSETGVKLPVDELIDAIRQRDTVAFRTYYKTFRESVQEGKFFSFVYTKYGISKLLSCMARIGNAKIAENRIVDQVFTCRDLAELDQIIQQALNKMDAQDHSYTLNKANEIRRYIENNYELELSLKDIAAINYFSPNYLCRFFKQETGFTVLQYINDCRMRKAQELLKNTPIKVCDVAQAVGYHSSSYFCQRFRDSMGVSPETYRRSSAYLAPLGKKENINEKSAENL